MHHQRRWPGERFLQLGLKIEGQTIASGAAGATNRSLGNKRKLSEIQGQQGAIQYSFLLHKQGGAFC